MARFMTDADYSGYIKGEIKTMITGGDGTVLLQAEETAIATITEYLGGIYNCTTVFAATGTSRNLHIVHLVRALALFALYHQTGLKDIPEHRKMAYDDAISWLKDAGRGTIKTTLPVLTEEEKPSDFRVFSKPPRQHKW